MLPWRELMKFGLGNLKLSPTDFWNMTLREIDAAIDAQVTSTFGANAPSAQTLEHLVRTYPDT